MLNSYEALFDVYDSLMYDVGYDSWCEYIISLLPDSAKKIAETACGTGNITLRLAKRGYDVSASDISYEMLDIAAKKSRKNGLHINFVCSDMCEMNFTHCDAVICCCDGVNYLKNVSMLESFFKKSYTALNPGGRLLFDISSEYKLKEILADNLFFDDSEDVTYIWQNSYNDKTDSVEMALTFFKKEGDKYVRQDEQQTQYAYSENTVLTLLRKCGFAASCYEFLTTESPNKKSERIQFCAQKPKETEN